MSFDPRLLAYVESPICISAFDSMGCYQGKFVIVCYEKVVRIPLEGDEILRVHGEHTQGVVKTLLNTKFRIDLVPEATSVAKSRYRLAPLEMQELSEQLRELQDKVVDALSRKERVKSRRVRGMILAAQSKVFKQENVLAERLHGLDPQMERKRDESVYFMDRIWVQLVGSVMDEALALRSPVLWVEIGESSLSGLELVQETTDKKGVMRFGKKDASLHVPLDEIKVDKTLRFVEEPVENSDREVMRLKVANCSSKVAIWGSKAKSFGLQTVLFDCVARPGCYNDVVSILRFLRVPDDGRGFRLVKPLVLTCESVAIYGVCDYMCLYAFMWIMWEIGSQSIECDHLNEIGMVIEIIREVFVKLLLDSFGKLSISYAFSVSLLLTPLRCDDIHDVTPRVSALAGCGT
ncbi:hypothetical protein Tco_1225871 [Tanacetum coccineum]